MCMKKDISIVLNSNGHSLKEVEQKGYVTINSDVFEPLTVEYLGKEKDGKHYSVAQHYELNGDLVDDPDIEYVEDERGNWCPVAYTDILGCQEIYPTMLGVKFVRTLLKKDIEMFSEHWGKNLKAQFC